MVSIPMSPFPKNYVPLIIIHSRYTGPVISSLHALTLLVIFSKNMVIPFFHSPYLHPYACDCVRAHTSGYLNWGTLLCLYLGPNLTSHLLQILPSFHLSHQPSSSSCSGILRKAGQGFPTEIQINLP